MDLPIEFLKAYFIPGSETFLLLGLLVGVILIYSSTSTRKWGDALLGALGVLYLLLSMPIVARGLEHALLDGSQPIRAASEANDAQTIVVLAGGSVTYRAQGGEINELSDATSLRVLEAARLFGLLGEADVLVSGGAGEDVGILTPESVPMQEELVAAGVPLDRIRLESQSGSTREQAVRLAAMLSANGNPSFVLVTSPIHMRRALAAMRAEGLDGVPSPSAQHSEGHVVNSGGLIPHPAALAASEAAIREALALAYYRVQGWIELP
ncbi:MAG: YdcF family protein [Anaerolineales bacterium]